MAYLIFIDTNVFLDFYRIGTGGMATRQLKLVDKYRDIIITNGQVEMEFKKNRQKVIINTIKEVKQSAPKQVQVPPVLLDAQPAKSLKKLQKDIDKQMKTVRGRIEKIMKNPVKNDPVYKGLQDLFRSVSQYNLTRDNDVRHEIRELAMKRFQLGYPPRKSADTSIGDAVNWEWIVRCAKDSGCDVIIVSRDSDYGTPYGQEVFLNDWLMQEFGERVGKRRKIKLTNLLTTAFKLIEEEVSDQDVKQEEELVSFGSHRIVIPTSGLRLTEESV